jgi:transposase InsO family protein
MVQIFKKWGKPKALRVDNGEPLGSPEPSTTTPLALWLIGYDIHVIWNRPGHPQDNGKVERNQSTSRRWSEIMKCPDFETAQKQLDAASVMQRDYFPVSRLKNQTRKQAFPEIYTVYRNWDDSSFEPMLVYEFIKTKKYVRKVSSNGQITQFSHQHAIGSPYKGKYVSLKLEVTLIDNTEPVLSWLVFDSNEKLIKTLAAAYLTKQNLLDLTVMSKN